MEIAIAREKIPTCNYLGSKTTAKCLSTSEATSVSKAVFQKKTANAAEVKALVAEGVESAMMQNPIVALEVQKIMAPQKLDFFHLKSYAKEMEGISGMPIAEQQRSQLFNALKEKNYVKLCGDTLKAHKEPYTKPYQNKPLKDSLIAEWESKTGQKWPSYEMIDKKTGQSVIDVTTGLPALEKHQFHHIIPQQYGGPHVWWNGHPVHPDFHQGGIHGKNSVLTAILKSFGE